MLMILSCHSQEPGELNDTPRSYSTSQAHCSAHRLPPAVSSSMACPGSAATPHFLTEPRGSLPLENPRHWHDQDLGEPLNLKPKFKLEFTVLMAVSRGRAAVCQAGGADR